MAHPQIITGRKSPMPDSENLHRIQIEQLKGVGNVSLELAENQRAYVFIGENGSGKTKILEAIFQLLFFYSSIAQKHARGSIVNRNTVVALAISVGDLAIDFRKTSLERHGGEAIERIVTDEQSLHDKPVIFIGSQLRGHVESKQRSASIPLLGNHEERRRKYLQDVLAAMAGQFNSLGMKSELEQWFLQRAASANRYQKSRDERSIEIDTVLKLLHKVAGSVDPDFLEVTGNGRVLIKINDQQVQLDHLSSGYSSILKIFQCIVAGYGALTNESKLEQVPGVVILDEIESHLHVSWQARIIPLLKELFPNTQFYISTHSPLVLAQLHDGEAYSLKRNEFGVMCSAPIQSPNKSALIDILKQAFAIDLNAIKKASMSAASQQQAKNALLKLLDEE